MTLVQPWSIVFVLTDAVARETPLFKRAGERLLWNARAGANVSICGFVGRRRGGLLTRPASRRLAVGNLSCLMLRTFARTRVWLPMRTNMVATGIAICPTMLLRSCCCCRCCRERIFVVCCHDLPTCGRPGGCRGGILIRPRLGATQPYYPPLQGILCVYACYTWFASACLSFTRL